MWAGLWSLPEFDTVDEALRELDGLPAELGVFSVLTIASTLASRRMLSARRA